MRMHAMAAPSRLGCAVLAVVLSLGLAACSSSSSSTSSSTKTSKSTTSWYNPVGWFESGPEKGDPAPIDGTAPDVADVPNRPEAKVNATQRKDLAQGLIADRDNAHYTDEELRGRPAGAPPPPVSATTPRPAPTPSFPTPSAAPRTGVEPAPLPPPTTPAKPQASAEPAVPDAATAAAEPPPQPATPVAEAAPVPTPATVSTAAAATTAAIDTLNVVPGAPPAASAPELAPAPRAAPAATAAIAPVAVAAAAPPAPAVPPIDAPSTNLMQDAFAKALAEAEARNRAPNYPPGVSPPAAVPVATLAGGPSPMQARQAAAAAAPAAVAGFPPVGSASPAFPGTGRQTPVAQINFAAGSAKLPADAGASLRRAADAWRQSGGLLRIVGRAAPVEADRTGRDVMASFTLAMNRAEAVGRELARIGVSPAALQIDGQGGDPGARDAATEIILEN